MTKMYSSPLWVISPCYQCQFPSVSRILTILRHVPLDKPISFIPPVLRELAGIPIGPLIRCQESSRPSGHFRYFQSPHLGLVFFYLSKTHVFVLSHLCQTPVIIYDNSNKGDFSPLFLSGLLACDALDSHEYRYDRREGHDERQNHGHCRDFCGRPAGGVHAGHQLFDDHESDSTHDGCKHALHQFTYHVSLHISQTGFLNNIIPP